LHRQNRLLTGSSINLIASLVSYFARFITSILVARTLGVEGKGVYTLTITTSALLALAVNFGFNGALTYLTASKRFSVRDLFSFSIWLSIVLGVAGGGIFYLLLFTGLVNRFLTGIPVIYIILVLIIEPAVLLTSFLSSILLGEQKILAFNGIETGRVTINLLLQLLSSWVGWGIPGAIAAWLVSNICALVFAFALNLDKLRLRLTLERGLLHEATQYGLKNYIANLLTFFNYRLDSYLVNFFAGPVNVGLYSTGVSMAELIWYIPNAVSTSLFPKISTLQERTATRLTAQVCRLVLLVTTPMAILFGGAGTWLIPWLFGEDFRLSVMPFWILLPGILGVAVSKMISADLSGRGKPQYATYTSTMTLMITIILDLVMIPPFGIIGAAAASTIAYLASAVFSVLWFNRETGSRFHEVIVPQSNDWQVLWQTGLRYYQKFSSTWMQLVTRNQ
jgi:O-antigen/teichoic acid export membrane protein